ncbi:MAG: hypothetical protein AABY87_14090 [bacterium]
MPNFIRATTFRGRPFVYTGELNAGLEIFFFKDGEPTGNTKNIATDDIILIRDKIEQAGSIAMGACRDDPSRNSLGQMLQQRQRSPQILSYVLPLLEEEGFLEHYQEGRAIWVKRK